MGESGLEINLVKKTNEDLKSEGFTIDVDTEVETTTEEDNQKKNKIATASTVTSSTATSSTATTAQAKKNTNKPARFKKEQIVGNGRYVYEALAGRTSDVEKREVIRTINLLDKDYVINFLNGYYQKRAEQTIMADRIITQITTEYGWSDEQRKNAVSKIVNSVIEYLKQTDSNNENIKKLNNALKSFKTNSKNAKLASEIDSYIIDGLRIKID